MREPYNKKNDFNKQKQQYKTKKLKKHCWMTFITII